MENTIKLVVCIHKGMWVADDWAIEAKPVEGEICTVVGVKPNGYLLLEEYEIRHSSGERRGYHPESFVEIINSKEEIAMVQVHTIQVPELCEQ